MTATNGDDDFTVNGNNFTVLGNVKISTGNGGGTTDLSPTVELQIDGTLTVTAAEGADTAWTSGAGVNVDLESVSFSSGNGTSNLDFSGAGTINVRGGITHTHLAGTSSTTFNALNVTINGEISVTNGDGNDTFDLGGANFTAGAITIRNGNGTGTTRIDDTGNNTINGNISITNGDGSDTFAMGGARSPWAR